MILISFTNKNKFILLDFLYCAGYFDEYVLFDNASLMLIHIISRLF